MKKKQTGIQPVTGLRLIIHYIKELFFPSKWVELKGEEDKKFRECLEKGIIK